MYTEITSIEEAFKRHPDQIDLNKTIEALSFLPKTISSGMLSIMQLQVVCYTINNDDPNVEIFEPDYNNTNQYKWGQWCLGGDSSGSGFRFRAVVWTDAHSSARGGARLALRDQPRLQHMKKCFPDVYKEFFLMLK